MQKSTVGGILSIVAGALGAVVSLLVLLFAVLAPTVYQDYEITSSSGLSGDELGTITAVVYGVAGFIGLTIYILSIVGGIFAVRKKRWGWALAGAISAIFAFFPLGIAAVILVAMGKPEFNQSAPVSTQASGNIVA